MNSLPEGVYKERERILRDLQIVSGMNDVGLGQKPEGVSSGRGFLVLQEAVDSCAHADALQLRERVPGDRPAHAGARAEVLPRRAHTQGARA
jgi:hypothetical protein